LAPPSTEAMVQLVAPPSAAGMETVLPRGAVVLSGQTNTFTPASFRWMEHDLPSLPSEPEQAANQVARPAMMKVRAQDPLFMFFLSLSSLRLPYRRVFGCKA
jgi:hypothetical protein